MRNIPNKPGWIVYKFEDFVENIREQVMPTKEDSKKYIGLGHLDSGSLHVRRWGTKIQLKGTKFRMKKGDLLFARRNAYLRRVAIAPHDGLFSAHGMIFRSKNDVISPDFLPFFLSSYVFMGRAIKISVGSLSPTINWGTLRHEEFSLPPLDEQKRLADLLWSVDETIESYVNLWEKIDILRKIHTRKLIENKTYPMRKISDVAIVTSGNSAPQGDKYFNGENPFVRVKHFFKSDLFVDAFDLINDLAIKDYKLKLFPKSSIVFTKSGASAYLEKKAMLKKPSYVVSHLGILIPDKAKIIPNYLFYVFKGLNISRNCVSDYPTIDLSDIKRWVIPVPDKLNQQTIVCEFNEMIKNQDAVKKAQVDLIEIKKQIINQIFGGTP